MRSGREARGSGRGAPVGPTSWVGRKRAGLVVGELRVEEGWQRSHPDLELQRGTHRGHLSAQRKTDKKHVCGVETSTQGCLVTSEERWRWGGLAQGS